jgi:hypothetical protein
MTRRFFSWCMKGLIGHRFWLFMAAPAAVIFWFWQTDPDKGADTLVRLQVMAWMTIFAGAIYLLRKAFVKGDSKEAWEMIKKGNVAAAVWSAGVAILAGLLFLAFAISARAEEPPVKALPLLPVLGQEIGDHWPAAPARSVFAGQVEQETCPSLKSKSCWSPRAGFKTAREEGIGLGQITITARFDNLAAARNLDPSLADWSYADRYDAKRQLRAMVLMDRGHFSQLKMIADDQERLAMSFSAYNGGLGGVLNDRRVCAQAKGCDPQRWFGHVAEHSTKAKVAAKGYGKSFFEINREYVANILGFRRLRYVAWFGEV